MLVREAACHVQYLAFEIFLERIWSRYHSVDILFFSEGVRERERNIMTMTLKQVAYIRDNTYHLQRHIWNDVQEDWPYYTEQEKALLKRRKPQNLTPPGSSDGGSSGTIHFLRLFLILHFTEYSSRQNNLKV